MIDTCSYFWLLCWSVSSQIFSLVCAGFTHDLLHGKHLAFSIVITHALLSTVTIIIPWHSSNSLGFSHWLTMRLSQVEYAYAYMRYSIDSHMYIRLCTESIRASVLFTCSAIRSKGLPTSLGFTCQISRLSSVHCYLDCNNLVTRFLLSLSSKHQEKVCYSLCI